MKKYISPSRQTVLITEFMSTSALPLKGRDSLFRSGSGGTVYSDDATNIRGSLGRGQILVATFDDLTNNVNRRCAGSAVSGASFCRPVR